MRPIDSRLHRLFVGVAVVGVVSLFASACGSSSGEKGGDAAGANDALVLDTTFIVQSMDPHRNYTPTQAIANRAMYDTLLTSEGSSTKPVPSLATSFEASADAKTYTFHLNKDAKFADGSAVTSADVLFSVERLINLKGSSSALLDNVTPSAPDPSTFVLTSSVPNPAIPSIVTTSPVSIVNSKLVKSHGGSDAADASKTDKADSSFSAGSAGSGPYVLDSYKTNNEITLSVNPNYWGPKKPHFKRVVIRNVDAASQLLNVQKGVNEVALDLSASQASGVKGNSKVQVKISPSPALFSLQANMDPGVSKVTSNPHIRQAIRYGMNYSALVQIGGQGAIQAAGMIPSMLLGSLPANEAVQTDLAKAKAEVAASGITDPAATLTYPSDISVNGVQFATLAQRIKADLATVGIKLKLEALPVATFLPKYVDGKIELAQSYWLPDFPDPNNYISFLPGGSVSKRINWDEGADPELEVLGKEVVSSTDDAARAKLFEEIQRKLNTNSPFMPLIQTSQAIVGSANLTGIVMNPSWTIDVASVGTH